MDPGKIDWRFSRRNQARPDRIYSPIAYERKPQLQGKSIFYRKREVTKMFEDKTLVCKECGKEFVFTAGEQEFYAERGFQNEPQERDPRPQRVLHRYLCCLRRRGTRPVRAEVRSPGLLQRLLRPHEGSGLSSICQPEIRT